MALEWNATKVADLETLHEGPKQASKTAYLCYNMMFCGVSRITETNAEDTWKRIALWEAINGALLRDDNGEPAPYTREDITARVGYWTNVSNETTTAWLKRFWSNYRP
jgi:hypothetical protein